MKIDFSVFNIFSIFEDDIFFWWLESSKTDFLKDQGTVMRDTRVIIKCQIDRYSSRFIYQIS